jgi:single-stranded-DNA-specific exonuclease
MVTVLRGLGCTVLPYVPDRMAEGYGPNLPALRGLVDRGATLVVCVDCGTAAGTVLDGLRGRADVLVLDHHKAEGPPPDIVATVNPNRLDCPSGHRNLCAGAIAFLAVVATLRELRRGGWFESRAAPDLMDLLDLVALSTVCDVMPLTGLNRALVTQGLRVMARRARPGIAALLDVAMAKDAPSAMTLGFALGPRINAAGRIKERFNRPACVAGVADGLAKGSGRSVAGIDLGSAVIAARQMGLLASGGGHAMAAGFSLPAEDLAAFHAFLDERLAAAALLPSCVDVAIEASVAVSGCTTELAASLARLAPFGSGNEEPVLVLPRVRVVRADRVGREGLTIRAFLEGEGGGARLKAVMFRAGEGRLSDALLDRSGVPLHLAGHLRAEAWNGSVTPCFTVVDAALA